MIIINPLYGEQFIPARATEDSARYDCKSRNDCEIPPGKTKIVPLGFSCQLPEGWEAVITGRSGMAVEGIQCHYGVIDAAYKKEICAILHNTSETEHYIIGKEHRICQIKFQKVPYVSFEVGTFKETARAGFGSTGKN